jgi:hypothetical protein
MAPVRLGSEIAQDALDAGRGFQRSLENAAEQAMLAAVDALVARLVEEKVLDRILARIEAAGVAQRVTDRILSDGVMEQVADRVLSGPELERVLTAAFQSALPEELIGQLLESEAVWVLVDEIARSPSVTEAIAHQGTGFAEQVAAKARDRSRDADSGVQRLADRLRRRRRAPAKVPDPAALPPPSEDVDGGSP